MAKTILLVEDNALALKVYETALAGLGATILRARTGAEALQMATESRPDVVVMDIMLPDMSGLDVTRQIKQDNALRDTKVIAVTTRAAAGDQQQIRDAGCDGFLPKPVNVDQFIGVIKDLLE